MLYLCICIYRYLRARVIRVPAGCARGGGGDGNGVARRRVNEMFSRGWLRHGVVIYKNVITLSERRRYSVSPGTTRRALNGCLPYNNNVPTYRYMRNSHTIATYYIHIIRVHIYNYPMTPHPIGAFGKYFCAGFSVCEFSKIFNRHNQTGVLPSSEKEIWQMKIIITRQPPYYAVRGYTFYVYMIRWRV